MCTLVNSLLQLERRKENNMSRLLSEESYRALTVILQGANMGEGYRWFSCSLGSTNNNGEMNKCW